MSAPEFSRTYRAERLGERAREVSIEAGPEERAALATRFGLIEIAGLRADAALSRRGEEVHARGALEADVVQRCIATGEGVAAHVEEPFDLVFRPPPTDAAPDEEIELGEAELDVIFYEGGAVDLGEAAAETLSLALDPFPRGPGAEQALREAGVKNEEEAKAEASPFAALAALRGKPDASAGGD